MKTAFNDFKLWLEDQSNLSDITIGFVKDTVEEFDNQVLADYLEEHGYQQFADLIRTVFHIVVNTKKDSINQYGVRWRDESLDDQKSNIIKVFNQVKNDLNKRFGIKTMNDMTIATGVFENGDSPKEIFRLHNSKFQKQDKRSKAWKDIYNVPDEVCLGFILIHIFNVSRAIRSYWGDDIASFNIQSRYDAGIVLNVCNRLNYEIDTTIENCLRRWARTKLPNDGAIKRNFTEVDKLLDRLESFDKQRLITVADHIYAFRTSLDNLANIFQSGDARHLRQGSASFNNFCQQLENRARSLRNLVDNT